MNNSNLSGGVFDLDQTKTRLEAIEHELAKPESWEKPETMTPLLQEKSRLEDKMADWKSLLKAKQDLEEWLVFAQEDDSQEILENLGTQLKVLDEKLKQTEMKLLLAEPEDKNDAILEIHPGAGGTEAQDWAEMLLRMYRRWAERNDMKASILDLLPGDEAGIKSVALNIKGDNAYGLLKGETGIHRLIRISPFDSSGRRHTSFASVSVFPDIDDEIVVDVKEEDLRVDVFRSSGPGGQSVNTTSSAVRVTHIPTGIVAQCQNEKSQLRNKETAIKILKARLYEQELKRRQEERQSEYDSKEAIAWGSQIRTYTLQPYRLVKDHRSGSEMGDVEAVLDGRINSLIRDYLLFRHGETSN
ncbi:peptide chain release factor 2 [Oceanidesulfovibrio indonesiensis]|uniref:Peptide chain release factor 2 n=1 Tax=Oceanidesulfovibrio indonesiensis TaxID=54767 RepID=A0A7M3MG72_9BACT|nr:peptide chain release factor 2 [Oceanidesulfovibrio indonesiensis]